MEGDDKIKVGLVGTGWIIRGLVKLLSGNKEMTISGVLTRRQGVINGLEIAKELVFQSPEKFFSKSDIIVVSTGDPIYSTAVIFEAFKYNLPVVTMDADTMVTTGTWLSKQGLITESNGDQPGCLAILRKEIMEMGFEPLVYGNIKGFRNLNPTADDMSYWALKQGYSLNSVTSFTDGTKVQIEQALVANAFDAGISKQGMEGFETEDFVNSGFMLADLASQSGLVISDYILSKSAPPGVFIVSTHRESMRTELQTYKMGDGPYYHHYKPAHLCFFEIPGTIKRLLETKEVLINNGQHPSISVAAIAKRKLDKGDFILNGIGSFDIRGEAVRICEEPNHVPVGLMQNVVIKENVEAGQIITFSDIDIPRSMALTAWNETLKDQKVNIEFDLIVEKLNNQP
ncbi:Predicted homoserine dehydrogenase, contains C-terminal SAF domain [Belliella buryatensis]|uniref:Predicted homoserine dehydrogenase, contains C-terminal SAF domain n=1 Tax=Belliella buryatensis TaxID=1500549 RepID=A0A239BIA1_9BACT|nr:NAD(P)-dependent oxidoreductase [Belliella buryatensis]SNS07546.1 Predicted homoserine dehydrogenase, contains C-terminal SAF domain [Belliella buryatensis]